MSKPLHGCVAFCHRHKVSKRFLVSDGQIGKHLPVDVHPGFFQPAYKSIVVHAIYASGGIYASDPQAAKFSLFLSSVASGVMKCLDYGFVGHSERFGTLTPVPFGKLKYFFVPMSISNSGFYPRHLKLPSFKLLSIGLFVRDKSPDSLFRDFVDPRVFLQPPSARGIFAGKPVAVS